MSTAIVGDKETFAIEYWQNPEFHIYGSFCLWFSNNHIGELSENISMHLGSFQHELLGLMEQKNHLYDNAFVGKSDEEIFEIIFDSVLNDKRLDQIKDEEVQLLTDRFWKFTFGHEPSLDNECIFTLYYQDLKQYKFLVRHWVGDIVDINLYSFLVSEAELEKTANEFSKTVENLRGN